MTQERDILGYVLMSMLRWENLAVDGGPFNNLPIGRPPGLVGYLPVYATLEALQADYGPDAIYLPIRRSGAER